jgi:hypothetical protein
LISLQLKKRRKIIVVGCALLALPAMIFLFDSLNRSTQRFNEALLLKQDKLAKYRQKVQDKKAVKRELLNLQTTFKRAEAALLNGKTPSLAAARILQPDRSGKDLYLAIPVEVTIDSTMRQLTQLLYGLDRSPKLLRITKLGIRSRAGHGRVTSSAGPVNIITTLTVEGFVAKMETQI